jgi:DNA helicase II / ATP-dependent DNA helicase PcrA
VRLLPGVGGKGADKLWQCFAAQLPVLGIDSIPQVSAPTPDPMIQGTDLEDKAHPESDSSDLPQPLAAALAACSSMVSAKSEVAWAEFTVALSQLEAQSLRRQPARMIRLVLEAGYEEFVKENFANYRNRLEDLEQLANFALQFPNTTEFLTQLSLLTNLEADEERPASKDAEQIRLSTVHQAKGLEFDVVFILMLCDGLFPSARSLNSAEGEEEERRLFYVALTRARQELYLSYPLIRLTQGPGGDTMQQRSRFLGEIPPELYEEWNLRPFNPYG